MSGRATAVDDSNRSGAACSPTDVARHHTVPRTEPRPSPHHAGRIANAPYTSVPHCVNSCTTQAKTTPIVPQHLAIASSNRSLPRARTSAKSPRTTERSKRELRHSAVASAHSVFRPVAVRPGPAHRPLPRHYHRWPPTAMRARSGKRSPRALRTIVFY